MVSSDKVRLADSGGYDCDFIDSIPDSLSCPVCLLPFRNPHQLDCCGIKICATCVGRIDAADQPCPQCRESFVHIQDKGTTRQVLGLKTRCSRNKDGCKWEGELRHLYTHNKSKTHEKEKCELMGIGSVSLHVWSLFSSLSTGRTRVYTYAQGDLWTSSWRALCAKLRLSWR